MAADRDRPPTPAYVFRGHTAQIHSVRFVRRNTCLVSGDADGWVVVWKLESKRPLAVWQAHAASILGTAEWGHDKLITHGRDHTLRIWQLRVESTSALSTLLPADGTTAHRPKPWLLHTLPVNTLNFCAFSVCSLRMPSKATASETPRVLPPASNEPVLVAVPARDDQKIDVYEFPDEKLAAVVPRPKTTETGMVMAVKLVHHQPSRNTLVLAGYEGGFTAAHLLPRTWAEQPALTTTHPPTVAETVYLSQCHKQPILSLDSVPDGTAYFTSSADALIAAHRIPDLPIVDIGEGSASAKPEAGRESPSNDRLVHPTPQNHHHGEAVHAPSSNPRDATAQKEDSAQTLRSEGETSDPISHQMLTLSFQKQPMRATPTNPSQLSSLLASTAPPPKTQSTASLPAPLVPQAPYKLVSTKHAGQQSLCVRSDGRLLATGGWDSRVRVYSTKTLKEVAVLKWHKEGVYAVDFGNVLGPEDVAASRGASSSSSAEDVGEAEVVRSETGLGRLQRQREEAVQLKHWIASGSKDGKVALWEVF